MEGHGPSCPHYWRPLNVPGGAAGSFDSARDDALRETQKFVGRAGEQLRFFFGRKFLHRFDEFAGMRFA